MLKRNILTLFFILGTLVFSEDNLESLGMITEKDFAKVGVKKENIIKAKEIINNSRNKYNYLLLDKKSKELEINKYLITGIEKNWDKVYKLIDEIGDIEAEILKDKIRAQYEAQQCITQEQYLKAREIAIQRLQTVNEKQQLNKK
ncbi:hypothetical protein [Fusobacterium perfoetens]|uniref:hypothetical protein n=1 Tax=Fusobacterium perfoetens TaxID=852 RepID=UPI00055D78D3|nr:hypothetical protein [Fusobacterium perfoetens]MCI6151838.1 hypothetical protein [Fusobacterium perfoetens]MDY3236801.1 hypothetical protein [Fusobacterium perfoetens]